MFSHYYKKILFFSTYTNTLTCKLFSKDSITKESRGTQESVCGINRHFYPIYFVRGRKMHFYETFVECANDMIEFLSFFQIEV